jgi:cellulose synthase/poly-beta-1,6-N-acetylglucosamine synthase-like glycosyltransferase
MILFFRKPRVVLPQFQTEEELPTVAVLIAAYNEESVIEEKLNSIYHSDYPLFKINVYVGSDASKDQTVAIVKRLQSKYDSLFLIEFTERVGKIAIVNHLQTLVKDEILILTDANVMFTKNLITELVKNFKSSQTGIVAANIIKESKSNVGISSTEKKYLSLENKIKTAESNAFNLIMGAEGGCYALRNSLFTKVPSNFIVDDFFITLSVINKGAAVIFNPAAICLEDVGDDPVGEYKRKVRISSGNFQNLFYFKKHLLRFWSPICFTLWSHKVLRWITPSLLIISLLSSGFLVLFNSFFLPLFVIQMFGFLVPVFNRYLNFKTPLMLLISHFYSMNFALLEGFIKFISGIKSSVWQPIKRNA